MILDNREREIRRLLRLIGEHKKNALECAADRRGRDFHLGQAQLLERELQELEK